jgi:hypothetical protein
MPRPPAPLSEQCKQIRIYRKLALSRHLLPAGRRGTLSIRVCCLYGVRYVVKGVVIRLKSTQAALTSSRASASPAHDYSGRLAEVSVGRAQDAWGVIGRKLCCTTCTGNGVLDDEKCAGCHGYGWPSSPVEVQVQQTLYQLLAKWGDPLDRVAAIHANVLDRIDRAEAQGSHANLPALRALATRTSTILKRYRGARASVLLGEGAALKPGNDR